jgi:hypothetical protein
MATAKNPRSRSRTQQRYARKQAVKKSARPVSIVGGGQGGILSPSGNAGSFWG